MFKKTISVLLAFLLVFSLSTVAFAGGDEVVDDDLITGGSFDGEGADYGDPIISFDTNTAGWGSFNWVAFHIWAIDDEDFTGFDWGAKKQRGSDEDGDGVWSYDLAAAGLELKEYCDYAVIFYNDNGAQTYNLLFGMECYGHTASCDGIVYENPEDSNKTTQAAFWEGIDPNEYGPELKITSIGNVVGTCCPISTSVFEMFTNFINNTMDNARTYSGRTDQEIIDNIAIGLELTLEEVVELFNENSFDVVWDAEASTVPSIFDPEKIYVDYSYKFDNIVGYQAFEVEKGDKLYLRIEAAAADLIGSVKGYIEYDRGIAVTDVIPFEDEKPYFTAKIDAEESEPGRTYFEIDLVEGADYVADEKNYIDETMHGIDDQGEEYVLYSLKGLCIAAVEIEVITDEPGVYPFTCVLTDAADVNGNVLMEDSKYEIEKFVCDTNFDVDETDDTAGYQRGDADMDGEVTIMDATRVQRVLAGLATRDQIDEYAADADADGEVTIMDATRIQRVLAGLCNMEGNPTYYVTEKEACDAVLAFINNEEGYTAVCVGKELDRYGKQEFFKIDLRHYNGSGSSHADWFYVDPYKIGEEVLVLSSEEFNDLSWATADEA